MKTLTRYILMLFTLAVSINMASGQTTIFQETFDEDPFIVGNALIDLAYTQSIDNGCAAPEYGIAANTLLVCNEFNSRTMTGNFLTIDNRPEDIDRIIYQTEFNMLEDAPVNLTYEGVHRSGTTWDDVDIRITIRAQNGNIQTFNDLLTSTPGIINFAHNFDLECGSNQITYEVLGGTHERDFGIDNILIEAAPSVGSINYTLENEDGEEKTTFCVWEEIHLDISGSTGFDHSWVTVLKFDQGNMIGKMHWSKWPQVSSHVDYPIHTIPNEHDYEINYPYCPEPECGIFDFEPGFDYQIILAFSNECTPHIQEEINFTIECCECCDNPINIEYSLTNGIDENNVFCYEDEIHLDISGSTGFDHSWVTVLKFDTDNNLIGKMHWSLWPQGSNHVDYPIHTIPDEHDYEVNFQYCPEPECGIFDFEPGFNYQIILAFSNECISHIHEEINFTINFPDEDCCDEIIFDYTLKNGEGLEKNTFCVGEQVLLDFSGSTGFDHSWVRVQQFKDGQMTGFMHYTLFPNDSETIGANIVTFPEHDYVINEAWCDNCSFFDFCPGYDYKILLAFSNECIGHIQEEIEFTIECCEDPDASFAYQALENGLMIAGGIEDIHSTPASCPTIEYWCLFELNVYNEFVLVNQQRESGNGYFYDLDISKVYKLQRTIITPCGTFCCAEIINPDGGSISGTSDCSVECERCKLPCDKPTNLSCDNNGSITLTWDDVSGAVGYEVEITPNGCCDDYTNSHRPLPLIMVDEGTSLSPDVSYDCYSWRVRTICDNGTSEWSDPMCMNRNTRCGEPEPRSTSASMSDITIYPNPFTESLVLKLDINSDSENIESYQIFNIYGQEVRSSNSNKLTNEIQIETNSMPVGTYMIIVKSNLNVYTKPIVKM